MHLENISISPVELYEKLKDEAIDLIALTGDFLDRKRTIPKLVPYLKILNQLHAKHGIFAVLGNHDYVLHQKDLQVLIKTLEKYNCKVLQNENDMIFVHGTQVNIIGIDDFSTKRSDLEASYKEIKAGTNLVLTHDPNIVLHMKKYHFDYLLAGHFHGGQICYPKAYHLVKMGKLARMNMIKGLHVHDGKPFYISEGLGQTGRPASITVDCNDLVKITFTAEDIAHSFTIDSYRISKRAGAGQSVTFEFRADQPGTFDYYCNLSVDSKCKGMRGRLLVK